MFLKSFAAAAALACAFVWPADAGPEASAAALASAAVIVMDLNDIAEAPCLSPVAPA